MKVGIVVVAFLNSPHVLFDSVVGNTEHIITWYIMSHTRDAALEGALIEFSRTNDAVVRLYRENRGLARSWNDGIIASYEDCNDLTLVINDDIRFHEGAFDAFCQNLSENSPYLLGFCKGYETVDDETSVNPQGFACFGFGSLAYEHVGAFDENFFPAYYEDLDYHMRATAVGRGWVWDERPLVDHERSSSLRTSAPEIAAEIRAAVEKNRAYVIEKWGGDTPSAITSTSAFGSRGTFIAWKDRHRPYGDLDRADLPPAEAEYLEYRNGEGPRTRRALAAD